MRSSIFIGLGSVAVLAFALYELAVSSRSFRSRSERSSPTAFLPRLPTARIEEGNRPRGEIAGEVVLRGDPPKLVPLKLGADPTCARNPLRDEQVLAKNGKLQNAVVGLIGAALAGSSLNTAVEVNQEGCVYRPRVQGAVVGQRLIVRNSDPVLHNVHAYASRSTLFNWAQPSSSAPRELMLESPGQIIRLKCDVHPWMTAYILVFDNPFFAVTGEDGAFRITGVPVGQYQIRSWHERYGVLSTTVRIEATPVAPLTLSYGGEWNQPAPRD